MSYQLVWFKRDLRSKDHMALSEASTQGPVRCIYIVEPQLWQQPDVALQHFEFIKESLEDLNTDLGGFGGCIEIHYGEVIEVLSKIMQEAPFAKLHSHEETGNAFTYTRDHKVAIWCKLHQVVWQEYQQFGVIRGLKNRNQWDLAWEKLMSAPIQTITDIKFWQKGSRAQLVMPAPEHLQHNPPQRQRGGRVLAVSTLNSFLNARSIGYRGGISSPLLAPDACSRISPYLSFGCLSMREVVQQTRSVMRQLPPQAVRHRAGLTAYISRLHWHCHFIQKLESEPEIEWQNMHRGYDGLRENDFNEQLFEDLKNARTGWPMVDACVTMLKQTGWLNFRMRAMLVSVAAYPLWLHWCPVGEWLATQFLDYEPGIHWSQLQMQSGTTGINTTRVYNPIKQAQDHDPKGYFVRKWLPPMRKVPDSWLLEPWLMTEQVQINSGVKLGVDMPVPKVDLKLSLIESKQRLHARRQKPLVKAGKSAIVIKHASRKNQEKNTKKNTKTVNKNQLGFDF